MHHLPKFINSISSLASFQELKGRKLRAKIEHIFCANIKIRKYRIQCCELVQGNVGGMIYKELYDIVYIN